MAILISILKRFMTILISFLFSIQQKRRLDFINFYFVFPISILFPAFPPRFHAFLPYSWHFQSDSPHSYPILHIPRIPSQIPAFPPPFPHSHPYSLQSHPYSPHFPHSVPRFPITAFTDSL